MITKEAVRKFQAYYGIAQIGTVGPVTRAKINELLKAQFSRQ
jgi:peptidoglycan hydrolase-like protein with peptidoglycan-binding domain